MVPLGQTGSGRDKYHCRSVASANSATFIWSGNDKIGEGMMTLLENRPNEYIKIKLEFKRPFEDTAITEFFFKGEGNQTVVTWTNGRRKQRDGQSDVPLHRHGQDGRGAFLRRRASANLKGVAEAGSKKYGLPAPQSTPPRKTAPALKQSLRAGPGISANSCRISTSHAQYRSNGRRASVPCSRMVPRNIG